VEPEKGHFRFTVEVLKIFGAHFFIQFSDFVSTNRGA
jgi:hypothetical protein